MDTPTVNRRSFLGASALLGAGFTVSPLLAAALDANTKKVKVGLIGCGGRGRGAIGNFKEACGILGIEVEVTAVGDAFKQPAENLGKNHGVPPERCFAGIDNYRKVIASGCDFVLDCSPPAFRPSHLEAAVEAGKHCFIEKPVAVDPVGVRRVIAAGEKAKAKGLAI
nr:Gfo/Idh/MocA family oxidoreductase [Akkermansiaceae bacterium]